MRYFFNSKRISLSSLLSWSVLSAAAFSGKDLIVLEEEWKKDYNEYSSILKIAIERENASIWIEYFVRSYIEACKKVLREIGEIRVVGENLDLTDRQKTIVSFFTTRAKQVTNRQVQRAFKISQLTASRELSLLTSKSLIIVHGKGRNTYYTRV